MQYLSESALYWAIFGVAVIVSTNARGKLRISISWFITVLILMLGIFVASMRGNEFRQKLLDGEMADHPVSLSEAPKSSDSTAKPESSVNSAQLEKDYLDNAAQIIGSALGCAGAVQAFETENLSQLTDSEFEKEQSRALNLRNQAAALSRQTKALAVPPKYGYIQSELEKTIEQLRLGGWAVHAYFGAENATEETSYRDQYRQYSKSASTSLKVLQQELLRLR